MRALSTAPQLFAILKSLFARFCIIDTSLPTLGFYWLHEDVVVARPVYWNEDEQKFYSRFRQRGGQLELRKIIDLVPPSQHGQDGTIVGITIIVAIFAKDFYAYLDDLIVLPPSTVILVVDPENDPLSLVALSKIGLPQAGCIRLVRGGRIESYYLLSATGFDVTSQTIAISKAKEFAIGIYVDVPEAEWVGFCIRVELPEEVTVETVALSPHRMIHDGSRVCEVSDGYSWLWIGAEKHLRVLLGEVPEHLRRVRVIVPKAFRTTRLSQIKLLLNGRCVETKVEIWGEGVGAVTAELPHDSPALTLGISVPDTEATAEGQSILAACIDRIELQP
jgi:hypothetical protein